MNRRTFFVDSGWRLARWSPWLGLLGLRFHAYANPASVGFAGWLTWCGRLVGFVPL